MTAAVRSGAARAVAVPRGVAVERIPRRRLAACDFVLVSDEAQYDAAVAAGGQPILVTRSFSVTDRRGRARLLLGGLIEPWRWRRVMLNEGIGDLTVVRGAGVPATRDALGFRVAAALAHARTASARIAGGAGGGAT